MRSGPGLVFIVCAVALGGLAVANLTWLSEGTRTGYDHGGVLVGDDRAVYAQAVRMEAGDRLVVRPERMGAPAVFGNYTFQVAAAGDRYAFLEGRAPREVHASVEGLDAGRCCSRDEVVWDRPAYDATVPTRPPLESNATAREATEHALSDPRYVELVWVFEYRPGREPPTDPEERRSYENLVEGQIREAHWRSSRDLPTVIDRTVVRAQPFLLGGMAAAALGAAVSSAAWVARLVRAPAVGAAEGTEDLLRLHAAAGTWLASVRDLLVASFAVTALAALHAAVLGEPRDLLYLTRRADIGPFAHAALSASLWILYAAVLAGWCVALVRVQRALARWRRRAAAPPEV